MDNTSTFIEGKVRGCVLCHKPLADNFVVRGAYYCQNQDCTRAGLLNIYYIWVDKPIEKSEDKVET